jgi:membrane dipeptidase
MRRLNLYKTLFLGSIILLVALIILPYVVDRQRNQVFKTEFGKLNPILREFNDKLFIVDLHSDQLLWNRNLLTKASYGHVDLPRLKEGNVAIQIFSSVTKTPFGLNYHSNSDATNSLTVLGILQGRPFRTWNSLLQKSLHHSFLLHEYEALSKGELKILRSRQDLTQFIATRKNKQVGALLSIEGAHALERKLENLDVLYNAGFRIIGLEHFFDNEVGGSAHGEDKTGLTPFGVELVRKMNELSLIIDLAHASDQVIDQVLALSQRPIMVSHTGVKGTCESPRNLSNAQLKKIAEKGGLVGIGFWKEAICGDNLESISKAIIYAVQIMGPEHVALGSDFDGAVKTVMDSSKIAYLTESLLKNGLSPEQVQMVMGQNALRFLQSNLP